MNTKINNPGFVRAIEIMTLSILILFSGFKGFSQATLGDVRGKSIDMQTYAYGYVTEIPVITHNLVGSSYLFDEWRPSIIDFGKHGKAEGLYIRYDLMNYVFQIQLNDKVKTIDGYHVEKFSLRDSLGKTHVYVNCSQFKTDETHLVGFFEVLSEGKYQLLKRTEAVIIESNYVQALDLGEKDDKISKKSFFYISRNDEVSKVPSSKKSMQQTYPEITELGDFLKTNKIKLRKTADLIKVVQIMNNLQG
ncbi:MAG TPA: hypothetical protein VI583_07590 [Cyclobacteriaceae bacterium]|nr:hypothetical protein [Cyclobacteriaceae bacterium]